MTNNYLYLQSMGMNDKNIAGDIKNHRIRTINNIDIIFDGKEYNMFFEFTVGNRYNYRKTHKITGKPLKHTIQELINNNALWIDTEFETPETSKYFDDNTHKWIEYTWKSSHRLSKLDKMAHDENLSYTKENILSFVNRYSKIKFAGVVIIETKADEIVQKIGGFREKNILKSDHFYKIGTWNDSHKCVEIVTRKKEQTTNGWHYVDGDSCEVDILNAKITG